MNTKKDIGKKGEILARKFLEKNDYSIIETNYMCRQGEIDIIAAKENELSFIEVKTRAQDLYGKPIESVTNRKKKHIYSVAEYYVYKNKINDINMHFDVIEVYIYKDKSAQIVHIQDAILEK